MIFEIIFNIIAVVMFITMFFKMIKKNNTQYLYILLMQFIGILINFIELIFIEGTNVTLKLIAFILSIMLYSSLTISLACSVALLIFLK